MTRETPPTQRYRLFVALVPPRHVLAELEPLVASLRRLRPELRWVSSRQWHLTLAFYGDVPVARLPVLRRKLANVAGRHHALRLALRGGGTFPRDAKRARVLWSGVAGDPLGGLAHAAGAAAVHSGLDNQDRQRFHAHLTLARCNETDLRAVRDAVASFDGTPWRATRFELIRSHQGSAVHYEQIASWSLRGPINSPDERADDHQEQ